MAVKRRKKRTHVVATDSEAALKAPKSFIIRTGTLSRVARQLVFDLRKVMEPNTATRLQERRRNKLKDFIAMAGPMGVSHLMLLSQSETTTNLRIGKLPQGPTLYFRIVSYSLMKEVMALQKKLRTLGSEFHTAPLLVLNNMPVESSHGKLLCSMFQNMFPSINTSRVQLTQVRRVVLFHYNKEEDLVEFRHYTINVKAIGISKTVKRIIRSEIPDLSNFADAADYVLKAEANLSDSEVEPDSVITLGQDYVGHGNNKSQQRSINLIECGPRLSMRLLKVTEGINGGNLLYHVPSNDQKVSSTNSDDEELTDN